ncbi:unnamed protein product [Darwinula stevensoni]|uniref:G-protein coupled receptors family 1 profile domain-containing protein n=1 Tax=Darwinula stevensoni TaxID=69355 RepID=A0A7R9AEH2_9CRUS|nr:unnamed protein product [Darwinula stevensoni]CAG0901582.1 unnamed protein product [Darwinula stevensoni]
MGATEVRKAIGPDSGSRNPIEKSSFFESRAANFAHFRAFIPSEMETSEWNRSGVVDADGDVEYYRECMEATRFWIQRVLLPIVAAVGMAGNSLSMIILTRKEMRSSIHWYLTGLAASDLLYLVFVFSLSFRHYPWNMPLSYWHYYPVGLWLSDSSSNTSVWLTVSFTVERYLAMKNPLKGKVWFTESRAKRVIALVYILCFLSVLSTPFEWRVQESHLVRDDRDESQISLVLSSLGANPGYRKGFYWFTVTVFIMVPLALLLVLNILLIYHVHRTFRQRTLLMAHTASQEIRENRVTVMLIAVSVLFLLCQSPTALVLIYSSFDQPVPNSRGDYILRICGNVFNLLMAMNAAINFLFYCALCDRYRRALISICRGTVSGFRDSSRCQDHRRNVGSPGLSPPLQNPFLGISINGDLNSELGHVTEAHQLTQIRLSDLRPAT